MTFTPEHIVGITTHARLGALSNAFRYGVDYVLIDPLSQQGPSLFSRNHFNFYAVHDRNHGSQKTGLKGLDWAHSVFANAGIETDHVLLLTQPSFMGYFFNPVSFWFAYAQDKLIAVIAEVNNTFGDRHSYLCKPDSGMQITPASRICAQKLMHVSPFQQIEGTYQFTFKITAERIAIRIAHRNGDQGVIATLHGPRHPLTNRSILKAALRRPLGSLRTIILIFWQALRLKIKGAPYLTRPTPPEQEVSECSASKPV